MTEKTVYVIFHCNQWHEYSSMRLIGVASEEGLRDVLTEIQRQLGYSDQDMDDFIHVECTTVDNIECMDI